jgi:hypothetical protein
MNKVKLPVAFLFAVVLATPAFAVDPTGVPECDAFLKRYEACSGKLSTDRVHAAQKELLDAAMGMRAAGQDPKARPDLVRYCADTFARMRKEGLLTECMSAAE